MLLVDSSVWIDYLRGRRSIEADLLDRALQTSAPLLGDLILTEVLQGVRDDAQYRTLRSRLLELPFTEIGGRDVARPALNHSNQTPRCAILRACRETRFDDAPTICVPTSRNPKLS